MSDLTFRDATADDVLSIVRMYADDALGSSRDDESEPLSEGYLDAFHEIDADPRHRLVVVTQDGDMVGTMQLSFLPHLVLRGGRRAQVEAVRVRPDRRGTGLRKAMFEWAIEQARLGGCRLVQLTTNIDREDAQRFYRGLGFEATHVGSSYSTTCERCPHPRSIDRPGVRRVKSSADVRADEPLRSDVGAGDGILWRWQPGTRIEWLERRRCSSSQVF